MHHFQYRFQLRADAYRGQSLRQPPLCGSGAGVALQFGGECPGGFASYFHHDGGLLQCGAFGAARGTDAFDKTLLPGIACFAGFRDAVQRLQAVYGRNHRYEDRHVDIAGRKYAEHHRQLYLINGKLGFLELGLLGAGISTLFSRIMMVVVFALIVLRGRRFIRYRIGFSRMGWSLPVFKKLNALGWPVGLQMGMETASFSLSAIMVGWLGTIALASHQIMLTISQFTFMMYYGMGAAVAVRVSNFKGQDDMENVRRSTFAGFHLIMAMEVVLMSIVFVMRGQVGGWFTDSAEASALVASLFFPFLIYQFGDGLQINFANALRGISDVKPMMVIAFISYFIISLPVGYFCGFVLGWGLVGVWMAFPFGLTSAGVMLWLRFRYKTRTR